MTVHVGQVTSEVHTSTGPTDAAAAAADGGAGVNPWEERARIAALIERISRDRLRTATGHGDD
jgi:hypothetical protein